MINKIFTVLTAGIVILYPCLSFGRVDKAAGQIAESLLPQAVEITRTALSNSESRVRTNAIEAVSAGQRHELMPQVSSLLKDNIVPVRFAAALAAGDLKYTEAKDKLQVLLQDQNLNVAMAAAYALARLGDDRYVGIITKSAKNPDETVRANSALLIGKLGKTDNLPLLYWIKDTDSSSYRSRFQATESIAMLGDQKIYQKVWTMILSTHPDDRIIGIRAMAGLKTPEALSAVAGLLSDPIIEVRLAAAEQLGKYGDQSGEIVVLEYLENGAKKDTGYVLDRRLSLSALAIGNIGTEKLAKYLPDLLKNQSIYVNLAAAKAVFLLSQ